MMRMAFGLALVLSAACLTTAVPTTAEAQKVSRAGFCQGWRGVCGRTCPQGPGMCKDVCNQRLGACLATGCFHFNSPRPRCDNNAEDVRLYQARPRR